MLWSDGFSAASIRSVGSSIWMLTATISPPNTSKISKYHTHVLSIGLKEWDHRPVINHYTNEIQSKIRVGKMRYCGISKKEIHTVFDVLVYLGDRKERDELVGVRSGTHFGLCWGYSMPMNPSVMSSCTNCQNKRMMWLRHWNATNLATEDYVSSCAKCRDWNITGTTAPFQYNKPKNYPTKMHKHCNKLPKRRTLRTKHILTSVHTFRKLKMGSRATIINLSMEVWTVPESRNYLKCLGVNDGVLHEMI